MTKTPIGVPENDWEVIQVQQVETVSNVTDLRSYLVCVVKRQVLYFYGIRPFDAYDITVIRLTNNSEIQALEHWESFRSRFCYDR